MVVVLDLDDTLYSERSYQTSGYMYLVEVLHRLYSIERESLEAIVKEEGDVLGKLSELVGCSDIKESLLWLYRTHSPDILLSNGVLKTLNKIKKSEHTLVLLTDGRSITQRLKLASLGLLDLPLYVSQEYCSEKPSTLRFEKIMSQFNGNNYMYVGDNPHKDFFAPNKLGWKTIGIKMSADNIHRYDTTQIPVEYLPDLWVDHFSDLENHLC
jgi:putative hydrolase of the HAD superfamily